MLICWPLVLVYGCRAWALFNVYIVKVSLIVLCVRIAKFRGGCFDGMGEGFSSTLDLTLFPVELFRFQHNSYEYTMLV